MKKIMAILVGFFTLASILIVGFFGTLPYTKEPNIYCDYILMRMAEEIHDKDGRLVIKTLTRPQEEEIKVGDLWFDNNYNYRILISDINYVFTSLGSSLNLNCKPMTNKAGKAVTDTKLLYYCIDPDDYSSYLSFNDSGVITFVNDTSLYTSSMTAFTFKVQSHDAHKQSINIRMQIAGIKSSEENV